MSQDADWDIQANESVRSGGALSSEGPGRLGISEAGGGTKDVPTSRVGLNGPRIFGHVSRNLLAAPLPDSPIIPMPPTSEGKIKYIARLQGELLRDSGSGHPEWYAEMLVAAAFSAKLMPTNHKHYDLESANFGRIQVKERVDGTDGKQNRTNFGRYQLGHFDHAAIVLFSASYSILGAVMIPCTEVLTLVRPHGHVKWADACSHAAAISISDELIAISGK